MDAIVTETWHPIKGHDGYEVSTMGRMRSWRTKGSTPGRASKPTVLRGKMWRGLRYYTLDGVDFALGDIMTTVLGEERAIETARDRDRTLTVYERAEIRSYEGIKPAHDVAEDFRLDPDRVRQIWDGIER